MSKPDRDKIVQLLSAEVSPFREELVRLGVDHVLAQKLRDVVNVSDAADVVLAALTEENVARAVERHVKPGFHRYMKSALAAEETVGSLVPAEARLEIHAIAKKVKIPRGAWTQGMVDPALVRKLFAPVWVHVLLSFGARLPVPGAGAASGAAAAVSSAVGKGVGGIAGRLSRSAEKLAGAGRTVMGGLGAEVERRVQAAAREFSEGAAEIFRDGLKDRLKSSEGRDLVEQIAKQAVDHVMAARLAAVHADVAAFPVDDVFGVSARVIGHAVAGEFVRGLVRAEISAYVELEGDRTLSEILTELGVLAPVRDETIRGASPLARGLFASDGFAAFLDRLLDA